MTVRVATTIQLKYHTFGINQLGFVEIVFIQKTFLFPLRSLLLRCINVLITT